MIWQAQVYSFLLTKTKVYDIIYNWAVLRLHAAMQETAVNRHAFCAAAKDAPLFSFKKHRMIERCKIKWLFSYTVLMFPTEKTRQINLPRV